MNSKHHKLISLILLLLTFAVPHATLAQGIEVNSADPAMTVEGTVNLDVTISGVGFDNTIDVVQFLLSCEEEPCTDTGGITVNHWKVRGSKKIIANIDVEDPVSLPLGYEGHDIEVRSTSRGRGGKGTTLFTVEKKSNQTIVSCDVFAPNGTCTCDFDWDQDDDIYTMLGDDCQTSETLWLGHQKIWAPNPTYWGTLRVVNCNSLNPDIPDCEDENGASFEGQFLGSSVIANTNHRAGVRFLNIRFDDDVLRGCDPDRIQSAVSFRLHGGIDEEPAVNSFLGIDDLSVDSQSDPLCNAIEVVRESGYTERWPESREFKARVEIVEITDDSYLVSGIRFEGIKPKPSLNQPIVFGNTIGAPACDDDDSFLDPDTARAIQFGRVVLPDSSDPSSAIAGRVESNTIRMTTSCGTQGGVGILILGEPGDPVGDQTTVEVIKNDVSGAFFGVMVDDHIVDINFSGNKLTGDGISDTFDTSIDSDAQCTRAKGKPNRIKEYDIDFDFPDPGCP
jgi:hypothetical protein